MSAQSPLPSAAAVTSPSEPRSGQRLKIAIVSDGLGDAIAGSFISTVRFADLLHARGHDVVLISSRPPRRSEAGRFHGMAMHRFLGPLVPWSDGQLYLGLPSPGRLRLILEAERVDVVHVMVPLPLGLLAVRVAKTLRLPVVIHSHTQPENIFLNSPRLPGYEALYRRFRAYLNWLYRQADMMIYPSAFAYRQFPELAGGPHVIISNGVDRDRFRATPARVFKMKFQIPAERPHLLYVGRLHKEKDVATLVRALPLIRGQVPGCHLSLIGLGYEHTELGELAQALGVASNVTFCGFVRDDELPAAYSSADLFVMPSVAELEGMAVLEAMACGRPLLVSNAPGSAAGDFVQGNGLLFNARDPQHLAEQACRLLGAPASLRAMGQVSLALSASFDIHASVHALESVYYTVLSRS
jgi:glycosyltransferase involved in cell wall biosynthesis